MNSIDLFEKSWIDLVFEGRNQAYGAYQLRRESSKTTIRAFFFSLLFFGLALSIPFAMRSFATKDTTKPAEEFSVVVKLSDIKPDLPKPAKAAMPIAKKEIAEIDERQLVDPEIVKATEADNIAKNTDNTPSATTPNPEGSGTAPTLINPVGIPTGTATTTTGNTIEKTTSLDKHPEFPGGMARFYSYVGNNFVKTDIGDEKTIRIYVSFVIERDGSMTDIKVPRDPGFGLGNEAIRVLKSLKTKWQPGIIDGQPVRTAYSLPITVKTE